MARPWAPLAQESPAATEPGPTKGLHICAVRLYGLLWHLVSVCVLLPHSSADPARTSMVLIGPRVTVAVTVAVTDRRPLTTVAVGAVAVGTWPAGDVGEGRSVGTGTLGDSGACHGAARGCWGAPTELEAISAEASGRRFTCATPRLPATGGATGRAGEVGDGALASSSAGTEGF